MFRRVRLPALVACGLALAIVADNPLYAQCSGGGRGGGPPSSSSTGSFNPLITSNTPDPFAYQQAMLQQRQLYAMQQLLNQQQMQMAAMRQQLMQQYAAQTAARQQELVAARQERNLAKQELRAERIAALKAKRAAEAMEVEEESPAPVRYASIVPQPDWLAALESHTSLPD